LLSHHPTLKKSEDNGEKEEKSVVFRYFSIPFWSIIPLGDAWKRKLMREECKTLFNEERERKGRGRAEKGKKM
jgi:hypothetical protein